MVLLWDCSEREKFIGISIVSLIVIFFLTRCVILACAGMALKSLAY
jgi:hypothetical protein